MTKCKVRKLFTTDSFSEYEITKVCEFKEKTHMNGTPMYDYTESIIEIIDELEEGTARYIK